MQLESFTSSYTAISDLSPLRGMRLTFLNANCKASDLSFLSGMPLKLICPSNAIRLVAAAGNALGVSYHLQPRDLGPIAAGGHALDGFRLLELESPTCRRCMSANA